MGTVADSGVIVQSAHLTPTAVSISPDRGGRKEISIDENGGRREIEKDI